MQRDLDYLQDILRAARLIARFIEGSDETSFRKDALQQSAVMWQIALIGEAASKVSDTFSKAHPEIPWLDMVGMRHRLIHGYRTIRLDLVWSTITEAIPALIAQLEPLAPPEDRE